MTRTEPPAGRTRLAIVADHPTQHFGPWFRAVEADGRLDLLVFYQSSRGSDAYVDRDFRATVTWDVPVLGGYRHVVLGARSRQLPTMFLRDDNPGVAEALTAFDPDVVLVFGYARSTNWRAVRWARRRSRKVLLSSDSSSNAKPSVPIAVLKQFVVRAFYRQLSGALCNSDSNRRYHERYGAPREHLYPCRLPIDLARLQAVPRSEARAEVRAEHGIPDDAFVAMFCGKFVEHKRVGDLIDALAVTENDSPATAPLWGLLVGDGPLRSELEARASTGRVRCRFTGFVNQAKIGSVYAAADVLVQPSSLDAHGLSMTEACALGLPIIASDQVGGVGDESPARPGRNALVYRCGDVDGLRSALLRLRDDPDLHRAMSAESESVAEDNGVARATELLYDAVIAVLARERPAEAFQGGSR